MKRSIGALCLVLICAGPPVLCAQELSGGVSAVIVSVGAEVQTNSDYEISCQERVVEKGRLRNGYKTDLQFSVSLLASRHWRISAGGYYKLYGSTFDGSGFVDDDFRIDMGDTHHLAGLRVNGLYVGRLFGRPFTAFSHLLAERYEYGFGRATGFAVGIVQLAQTEASSFGIGMIGLINTTSPWPVFPMLVYRHRFDKRWSMEIMPPQFRLTCAVNPSNRITAGLTIDGDRFYVTPRNPQLPKVCLYSKSLMRPELKYETKLSRAMDLCVRHGGCHVMSSRLYGRNGHAKLADIDTEMGAFWAFQLSAHIF